jgi:hypothetical protein
MNIKNCILYGSNFGFKSHFFSLKKLKFKDVYIYSPNIKKKKINLNKKFIIKEKQIFKKDFELISIATPPSIQKKIIYKSIINRRKYLFLEKPLAENYLESKKIFNFFKKKHCRYFINFIFPNIVNFQNFKKILKNKVLIKGRYTWKFKQGYFKNSIPTWKINNNKGGGLVNFYLIHVIFNLLELVGPFKIQKIKYDRKKITTKLYLILLTYNNISIEIDIDINSENNVHSIFFEDAKNTFKLSNISKDWVKNFKILINNKEIKMNNHKPQGREELTLVNFKKLISNKNLKKNYLNFELAHKYCDKVNKFIKKND